MRKKDTLDLELELETETDMFDLTEILELEALNCLKIKISIVNVVRKLFVLSKYRV